MSELYSNNDWRNYDELKHHGILGQKWGVRNGPPYPLDSEDHDRVIAGRKRNSNDSYDRMNVKNSADMTGFAEFTRKDSVLYLREHPIESISQMDRLKPNASLKDARFAINHPGQKNGRYYNCPNCAAAFDMVERGYDVIARPKPDGSNVEDIESFYKGGFLTNVGTENYSKELLRSYDDYISSGKTRDGGERFRFLHDQYGQRTERQVIKELKSQGNNSRGILVVGWRMDEDPRARTTHFHALNYKIENGEIVFYDAQSKREYNGYRNTDWIRWECDPREVFVMRTDNLQPSDKIGEAVISRRKA